MSCLSALAEMYFKCMLQENNVEKGINVDKEPYKNPCFCEGMNYCNKMHVSPAFSAF